MGLRCETEVGRAKAVPDFPEFRPVELADRDLFENLFQRQQPVISEFTFANLYVWRKTYDFAIAGLGGGLAVRARDRAGNHFFLPPIGVGDRLDAAENMLGLLAQEGYDPRICRVPKSLAGELESAGFRVESDRDNYDYVYLSMNMIDLPGRKLHGKRNHIAQFRAEYSYEYRRVTPDLAPACVQLQEGWCDIRDCFIPENRGLAEEHEAVIEALDLLEPLRLSAGAIVMDGKVAAFSVGGKLNNDTFVIHFEKATPAYPGLYQVINQEFTADVGRDYRYVNREQDLGDPGLRRAKESYYPHHLVEKFVLGPMR